MMKNLASSMCFASMLLASLSFMGCASEYEGDDEAVGEADQAIVVYGHLKDVVRIVNDQSPPDKTYGGDEQLAAVQSMGLPVWMRDSGNDTNANSGQVCYKMTLAGEMRCVGLSDFTAGTWISVDNDTVFGHGFRIKKLSHEWQASYGQSGNRWSWENRARYGQGEQ